ncbi:InlB B-repeat-containing protein [Mariniplasma anaerobium]|uniref:Peptidase M1 membrane alanine aminopeptidase domain-containing protein n=1 Tax=Mariniplasma anaerobium TaxID=2735436 RepID=A0A7U9THD7_9MOLU|nr:InlB B-repeat-containing protein [Mariniplasma anaerobium]BCR35234.1 hypothetical protein MPAN_001270 [Mariniplasma anaerobium]
MKNLCTLVMILIISSMITSCGKEEIMYTVNFETSQGSLIEELQVKEGTIFDDLDNITTTRDGYIFITWYLDETLQIEVYDDYPIVSDIVFFAKWEVVPDMITITFNLFDDEYIEEELIIEKGSTINPNRLPIPTRIDYIFDGWYLNDSFLVEVYSTFVFNMDRELCAKWIYDGEIIDEPDEPVVVHDYFENDNVFLNIEENKVFTENTYYFDLVVDDENDRLFVSGQIVYVNDEMDFDELYLKIYPNADNNSINEYNVNFSFLKVNDIEYSVKYSGGDDTTIYLDLEETLYEGETFIIDFEYYFTYWDHGRIASIDSIYYSLFFYPFVAMFDEDTGWQIDNYSFLGESYYNKIGDYYVSLRVPKDYLVAASGAIIETIDGLDYDTFNMYLENGRDFSFSTSINYNLYQKEIEGINYSIYSILPLSNPDKVYSFEYLSDAIAVYEDYVGEYYYDYLNLEYGYVYGMESSGVVYCSYEINETTVVHEVIHQWFYSMIGNDQSNFAFLDEALTTYINYAYFYEIYGVNSSIEYLESKNSRAPEMINFYNRYYGISLLKKVDEYEGNAGYAYVVYSHGCSMFRYYVDEFLDGDDEVFKTFLREYYNQFNGKEVTLDEFLLLLETSTGVDGTVEWFELMLSSLGSFIRRP